MNVVVGDQKVPLTIVDNKLELSAGGGLKMENGVLTVAEISTVSNISANATSNDPAATSAIVEYTKNYVAEKATVTVEKQATAESGYASTYVIKQGGVELGTKINIPKDFLVKSAELKECSEDGKPDANLKVGDKYIDFVINTADDSETAQHVYLKVEDLVDVYTGLASDTIDLSVVGTQISAYVREGSIAKKHLAEDVITWGTELSNTALTAAEGKITAAINALDVDEVTGFIKSIKQVDGKISATTVAQISSSEIADIEKFATKADIATLEGLTALNAETVDQIIQATQGLSNYTELTDFNQITSDHNNRLTALESTSNDLTSRVGTIESNITDITDTLKTVSSDYITQDELDDAIKGVDVTDQLKTLSADTLTEANGYTDGKITDLNIGQYAKTETVNGISQKTDEALAAAAKALTDANKHTDDAIAGLDIDQYAKTADVESTYATKTTVTTVSNDLDKVEEALSKTGITSISTLTGDSAIVASKADVAIAKSNAISDAKTYTNEAIANIGTPLRFVGVTTDENLAEGSEKADISGLNFGDGIRDGDVALNTINGTEFVWHGGKWHIIGDQNNHATTAALNAEEDARKAADAVLSNAIDNKLFYGNHNGSIISAESLSVVKISRADYHNLVAEEKVADNVVYIVNNDGSYSMYGETIFELSTPGIEGTSEAANTLYVNTKVKEAIDEIPLSVSQLVWDITTISCGGADL